MIARLLLLAVLAVQPIHHKAILTWTASTSGNIAYYKVYRSITQGGPYQFGAQTTGLTVTDGTVKSGHSYYYVATAVDTNLNESAYSNEVKAVIP